MSLSEEFRALLPTWSFAVLLPIPMATFWADGSGRAFAYVYLFVGCSVLAAESFSLGNADGTDRGHAWRTKLAALALGAGGSIGIFTVFAWSMLGWFDPTVPVLATLAVIPALGCVPYLTLVTQRPYAAVLFVACILASVKLAGCAVIRVVFGPTALADGRMALPWENPNLLVWLCVAGALACSLVMHFLGRREFRRSRATELAAGIIPAAGSRG